MKRDVVLLTRSGQWSSSQSECEHDGGGVHGNTELNQCIIYSSLFSVSGPLLQWNRVYIHAHVIHRLISPDVNRSSCQQSLLTVGSVFLSYLWVGWPIWGQKLICTAPNVIIGTLLSDILKPLGLFLCLSGWMEIPYWSVLFLSCGFETIPTLWMSDDSLPLEYAGYMDSLWVVLTSPALSVDVLNRKH